MVVNVGRSRGDASDPWTASFGAGPAFACGSLVEWSLTKLPRGSLPTLGLSHWLAYMRLRVSLQRWPIVLLPDCAVLSRVDGSAGLWVPIIRSWALTGGYALRPGTRNRYEIRCTKTQHRPASRQVNHHGRVSGTHSLLARTATSMERSRSSYARTLRWTRTSGSSESQERRLWAASGREGTETRTPTVRPSGYRF